MTLTQFAEKQGVSEHLILEPWFQRVQGPKGYIWFTNAEGLRGLYCVVTNCWPNIVYPVKAPAYAFEQDWCINHRLALKLIGLKAKGLPTRRTQSRRVRLRVPASATILAPVPQQ
jgi:hypothetical protein